MGRGKDLTNEEITKIKVFKDFKLSLREIANKLNRSVTAVRNYLNQGENYRQNRKYDNNKKLTDQQKRLILREVRKNNITSTQIQRNLNLPVSARRVRQILKSDKNLKFTKMLKKPPLTQHHKNARLAFAEKHIHWTSEWNNVIFSDEKRFNLDGPDGYACYWHDFRNSREIRMSRNFGGGGVMIWASFFVLLVNPK